jgi:hypothetical protein
MISSYPYSDTQSSMSPEETIAEVTCYPLMVEISELFTNLLYMSPYPRIVIRRWDNRHHASEIYI